MTQEHGLAQPHVSGDHDRTAGVDERDDAVLTRALAVLGLLSLPLTGAAGVALGLGADVAMIIFLLMAAELLTGVIAFAVIARRI